MINFIPQSEKIPQKYEKKLAQTFKGAVGSERVL
jgi:hypothetical protein